MNESFINDPKYPTYPKYPKGIPLKKGPPIDLPMGLVPGSMPASFGKLGRFQKIISGFLWETLA